MTNSEKANESAIGITSLCKRFKAEFPGFDKLGLNPDIPKEKIIGDSIVYAVAAADCFSEFGASSPPFIRLETMLHYDIVSESEVISCINQVKI